MNAFVLLFVSYVFELVILAIIWLLYCLVTGKRWLIVEKLKGCLDILKYVFRYWFDLFCVASYGVILAGEAVIQFFWVVGVIVEDAFYKIIHAARATVKVIRFIVRWTKRRQAAKKLAFQQKTADAMEPSNSSFDPEPVNAVSA